ncbi:hypothetical protein DM02DRAFT_295188 [Periconia macrospinosa]|uniref:Uncharacterized protein n=1 Tax=Periconia macrospinosa TaxID=97972 RepID=A0A2V1D2P5_9PLEO|nr:hypothetical protein DM02DRAFT_295188 [Periconia macrospinosa]
MMPRIFWTSHQPGRNASDIRPFFSTFCASVDRSSCKSFVSVGHTRKENGASSYRKA